MKKFMALLLILCLLCSGSAISDVATPTDLEEEELIEIDDDDWGEVNPVLFDRRVFISMEKPPEYFGDTMTLVAVLMDFQPNDQYTIYWQQSTDEINWLNIDGEHQQTYTVIIDETNYLNSWRVLIVMEEEYL